MLYTIPTKLVGVSFQNEDGSERQSLIKSLKQGDNLTIEAEPSNKYDSNSHVIKFNSKIIGHISRELSADLVNKKLNKENIIGIKEWKVTGSDKHTLGVNVIIEIQDNKTKEQCHV